MTVQKAAPRRVGEFWGVPLTLALGAALIFALSFVVPTTWLFFLQKVLALGLFAVATNLLVGYGGMVSFGQAVFYGLGAYMIALGWQHYDAPFWLLLVLAPLFGAAAALGDAGSPASTISLGVTSGLNADGRHDHIRDSVIPTFLHCNIGMLLFAWVASLVL